MASDSPARSLDEIDLSALRVSSKNNPLRCAWICPEFLSLMVGKMGVDPRRHAPDRSCRCHNQAYESSTAKTMDYNRGLSQQR